jgi:putative aldouronate transport system permease protein
MAFKNYNYRLGVFGSAWTGFTNFRFLFISGKLFELTRNTMLYNLAFIAVSMVLEVSMAIFINEMRIRWFKKLFQSFIFLPYFISWVVVVAIVQALFSYESGLVNSVLEALGADRLNININAGIWPAMLVGLNAWKITGYGSIVYLSSVTGIDPGLNEAAEIDGANLWQRICHVTLPCLLPTIIIMALLAIGRIFRGDFGMFYQLVGNNGVLLSTTDILDTYIYRSMLGSSNLGMTSAAGLYQSVLCFVTIITVNKIVKVIKSDYSLF